MILLIDNYDSFVYNIARYIVELGEEVTVWRNNEITLEDVSAADPAAIVISPGPCGPREAGISVPVVRAFHGFKPILGICLGHQCIGYAFGGMAGAAASTTTGRGFSPASRRVSGSAATIP